MARLTKITRSNPLSRGTQVAPDAGGGFALFATALEEVYKTAHPIALNERKLEGMDAGLEAGKKGGPSVEVTPGYGADPVLSSQSGKAHVDDVTDAHPKAPAWLVHNNLNGKTRNQPISERLQSSMSFLGDMGVTMHVGSGGQMSLAEAKAKGAVKKGKVWYLNGKPVRIGSPRHDDGNASDVVFYKDGRALRPKNAEDLPILTDIVRRAKANGLTGFGEGDDYMGPGVMHIGFGAPAVWGAQGSAANAPAWLREAFYGDGAPAAVSGSGPGGAGYTPGYSSPMVEVRAADGKIELKQYSKFAGPYAEAYNIAAQSAYHDTVLNDGATDLAKLRMGYEFDPDGYAGAAQKYVDEMVKSAPDMLRTSIRSELEREVQRTTLGIMEAKQGDIRKRASNANRALIDRYSTEYEDALLSGDETAVATARQRLGSVLRVRENLPGSGWTPESSDNAMFQLERGAQIAAERKAASDLKAYTSDVEDRLETVIKALKAGESARDEGLIDDPNAQTVAPDLIREANGFRALRDTSPRLLQMTPDQVDRFADQLPIGPVGEDWELDRQKAAEDLAYENRKAWEKDPVKRAEEVLDVPPPSFLSAVEGGDPKAMIAALGARRRYMNELSEQGFTDDPVYFSEQESELLAAAFGKEVPVEARIALTSAISTAFGPDAVRAFGEINGDPATMYAGKMMASGGSSHLAAEIIKGQGLLDEGVVSLPSKVSFNKSFNDEFGEAFANIPMPADVRGEMIVAARAIYASRVGDKAEIDDEDAKELLSQSIQTALGAGRNKKGDPTGGVQDVLGSQTLLPIGVNGEAATAALETALSAGFQNPAPAFGRQSIEAFAAASDMGVPHVKGKPISDSLLASARFSIVARGPRGYGLTFTRGTQTYDAEGPNGERYIFDLEDLIDAVNTRSPVEPITDGRMDAAVDFFADQVPELGLGLKSRMSAAKTDQEQRELLIEMLGYLEKLPSEQRNKAMDLIDGARP